MSTYRYKKRKPAHHLAGTELVHMDNNEDYERTAEAQAMRGLLSRCFPTREFSTLKKFANGLIAEVFFKKAVG